MKPEYEPKTTEQKIGYFIEETGEVLQAVGKTIRWGLESFNPELNIEDRETNRKWVIRELQDLKQAIIKIEQQFSLIKYSDCCNVPLSTDVDKDIGRCSKCGEYCDFVSN